MTRQFTFHLLKIPQGINLSEKKHIDISKSHHYWQTSDSNSSDSKSEHSDSSASEFEQNQETNMLKTKQYKVDGFYDQSVQYVLASMHGEANVKQKVVLEYFGCLVHSCPAHYQDEPNALNPVTKKSHKQTLAETEKHLKHIATKYQVDHIWSCEWNKLKQSNPEISRFCREFTVGPRIERRIATQEEMAMDIVSGRVEGIIQISLSIAEELHAQFRDMPPLFLSPPCLKYAELHELMKLSQKLLTSSFKGEKLVLSSTYIRYLVKEFHCQIEHIFLVVQFNTAQPFENFIKEQTDKGRQADSSENDLLANVAKLFINSSYGYSLLNYKTKKNTKLGTTEQMNRAFNSGMFSGAFPAGGWKNREEFFEISKESRRITHRLPIQIGFQVLFCFTLLIILLIFA